MVNVINRFFIQLPIWWIFGFVLIVKFLLAFTIPITGDEAYWAFWGRELHWGYYCHPPMVGWLLYFLMKISDSLFILRLPPVLITIIIAGFIYKILLDFDKSKAKIFTTIFLLSPINLLFVIVSTDTAVVFFLFFAALCLFKSQQDKSPYFFCFLSGFFFGPGSTFKIFYISIGFFFFGLLLVLPYHSKRASP